mgnify:FL=1
MISETKGTKKIKDLSFFLIAVFFLYLCPYYGTNAYQRRENGCFWADA